MRKLALAVAALAVALVTAAGASAATIDPSQLAPSACGTGTVVVNAYMGVRNDADSGFGGYWALDSYVKQIVVVQTAPDTFCAIARYGGGFTTFGGTSPSGTGTVSAGVHGVMGGGYRSTSFTATFTPTKPLTGYLGTYDFGGTPAGNTATVDWTTWYFNGGAGAGFDLAWWGWQYYAPGHGSWVNASSGSSGDITG